MVEIVPYVRFGSVIFGEKSYELDVNMDLPAGFLVRCDAVGAVDAVVTNSTEGLVLDGYGPLGLSFAEASRAFGGAGSIVRPRGLRLQGWIDVRGQVRPGGAGETTSSPSARGGASGF